MTLETLRREIDAADEQILAGFVSRMRISDQIAAVKRAQGLPIENKARERAVLDAAEAAAGAYGAAARQVFALLIELSKARQNALNGSEQP